MTLKFDLHTHSTASDGTLTPTQLIAYAYKVGIHTIALTDHDSLEGIKEAQGAANKFNINLIPGTEISVTWKGNTIHIIALGVNINYQPLNTGLAYLLKFRNWRAKEISSQLSKYGIRNALEGARLFSNGDLISRTHFARYLVKCGVTKNIQDTFKNYLTSGNPGYVPGEWASLEEVIKWIRGAGGDAVIAHPSRYKIKRTKLSYLIGEFKECGGVGIEVISGRHNYDEVSTISTYAKKFSLFQSAGSDFHGLDHSLIGLGNLPEQLIGPRPIWDKLKIIKDLNKDK